MCDPITLATIGVAAGGGYSAYNQYKEGSAANKYYQYQADQAEQEAQNAEKQGALQSKLIQDSAKEQGKNLKTSQAEFNASQKVALVSSGQSGATAEDIVSDSQRKQNMDEALLRYNADAKSWEVQNQMRNNAWATRVQADQYRYAGKNAKAAGKRKSFSTLLGTATKVAAMSA